MIPVEEMGEKYTSYTWWLKVSKGKILKYQAIKPSGSGEFQWIGYKTSHLSEDGEKIPRGIHKKRLKLHIRVLHNNSEWVLAFVLENRLVPRLPKDVTENSMGQMGILKKNRKKKEKKKRNYSFMDILLKPFKCE